MIDGRLNIAFVWHMHQPLYKDPFTGEYTMPWVCLHGTKDYFDMAAILEEFPEVRQTFNYVPCLVEQLEDYSSGRALDRYRTVCEKPAAELTRDDKIFLLRNFFQANWQNMVKPLSRYRELLKKRGISNSLEEVKTVLRYFNEQDYLDLQVLFNLAWIDPQIRRTDELLSSLERKGKGFSEDDKKRLLAKQTEIIGWIVPKHRELAGRGIIEITASPYFHPILPLLCDSYSAKEAMPWATFPSERFTHPEDAAEQLRRGVEKHKKAFGSPPKGLWPSEGSVSMDILPLVADAGIDWFATDEEILSKTIRRPIRRDHSGNCFDSFLYRPYTINAGARELKVIFRDHVLSDLIGFDYAKIQADTAANDFISRLIHIHSMVDNPADHLVSIILDGENAWETYINDGRDFLTSLYSKLSGHPLLKCVTVSEFLSSNPRSERLDWIFPGSWINHNFKIWIGHPEDNAAWDYIIGARKALVEYQESLSLGDTPETEEKRAAIKEAWDILYAAEGSDWFWWYGEDHSTMSDELFDNLFRRYIKKVYSLIEKEPPLGLDIPIITEAKVTKPATLPTAFIQPRIDGEISNYFEWLSAGSITRQFFGSAMHREVQGEGLIEAIAYGFSRDSLFFRFDYNPGIKDAQDAPWRFFITFLQPEEAKIEGEVKGKTAKAKGFVKDEHGKWNSVGEVLDIASERVVELRIPLSLIGAKLESQIRAAINIDAGKLGVERWPIRGYLILDLPAEDFEEVDWIV